MCPAGPPLRQQAAREELPSHAGARECTCCCCLWARSAVPRSSRLTDTVLFFVSAGHGEAGADAIPSGVLLTISNYHCGPCVGV